MDALPDPSAAPDHDAPDDSPSKSQRKRDMHALQALGERLVELPASQLERIELPDSYHVATLDNDAEAIFDGSLQFVRRLAPAAP